MAKQLPGPKSGIIRVQMDPEELHRMLDPILNEVNELRRRVAALEAGLEAEERGNNAAFAHLDGIVSDIRENLRLLADDGR